jgi:hypothetical protein
MIRLALALLALAASPAAAQTIAPRCTDIALTLETNLGGGMRVVSAVVRNLGATPFTGPAGGTIRVAWHGENASELTYPLAAPITAGAQASTVVGMFPEGMHGTLHATLQPAAGSTRDCSATNNQMRLAL